MRVITIESKGEIDANAGDCVSVYGENTKVQCRQIVEGLGLGHKERVGMQLVKGACCEVRLEDVLRKVNVSQRLNRHVVKAYEHALRQIGNVVESQFIDKLDEMCVTDSNQSMSLF